MIPRSAKVSAQMEGIGAFAVSMAERLWSFQVCLRLLSELPFG